MEIKKLEAAIEAILFTMGNSVELAQIADAIQQDKETTRKILQNMMDRYQQEDRGIQIIELEQSYQMCSKKEYYECLIRLAMHPKKPTLTDVMLETLSIIAYKQPVTKAEIEKIRGVKCDHAINKLVEYELVKELGRLDAPGRPILLGTTEEFLRCFGVQGLEDLPEMDPVQQKMAQTVLTPEEQKMVDDFASKIDVENLTQVMQYGAGTQKKMADFSDEALKNVRAQDLGEVGELLSGVVGELKGFDAEEEKGFLGFFKKQANKVENLKNRYDKAEVNVEKIADALEKHQVRLLKDSAMMDKMYEQNLLYFKELSMYIQAGKQRLAQTRNGKLHDLEEKAKMTGLPEDAQAAKDLDSKCARFEKKLHDLELTRMISLQTAPQIRLVQNNDTMMAEKIQTTLVNTIPLWKSQMVLALGIAHSTEAAQAQSQVSDLTNELLRKNAEKLHMASVETAKESERGIVDMETLQKTNADLIQTLDDVMKIQKEGREKRQAAEAEMVRMENDLKAKLLEIQH